MTLKDRLMADMKTAMRQGDTVRRDTIRMTRAAIKNIEIDLQREATDEDVVEVILRQVKRRNEAAEMFRQGGREELAAAEEAQAEILQEYLPEQLTAEEIREVVQEIVDEMGATSMQQMGPVMGKAMSRLKGKADGHLVNEIARDILSRQV